MDADVKRALDDLKLGSIQTVGTFALATAPATSTSVDRRAFSSNSILLIETSQHSGAITALAKAKGSFTITHTSSATVRTFAYAFFTGPDTP